MLRSVQNAVFRKGGIHSSGHFTKTFVRSISSSLSIIDVFFCFYIPIGRLSIRLFYTEHLIHSLVELIMFH